VRMSLYRGFVIVIVLVVVISMMLSSIVMAFRIERGVEELVADRLEIITAQITRSAEIGYSLGLNLENQDQLGRRMRELRASDPKIVDLRIVTPRLETLEKLPDTAAKVQWNAGGSDRVAVFLRGEQGEKTWRKDNSLVRLHLIRDALTNGPAGVVWVEYDMRESQQALNTVARSLSQWGFYLLVGLIAVLIIAIQWLLGQWSAVITLVSDGIKTEQSDAPPALPGMSLPETIAQLRAAEAKLVDLQSTLEKIPKGST
jgi:hypothetical protein